ncbi:MAG TPA: M56 family metallopeptidase [Longimicrobium sp.]|jgi:hypothetical protein|uniref:M56 family metallopeptidase n=1 Tax=Longimicrobium sp. TaxID=2029185 RepID=UPI002EDACC1E
MIGSWMLYALLVSLLVAAAAWTLEEVLRLRGRAVRFVWLGALLGTGAVMAAAPLRSRAPVVLQAARSAAAVEATEDGAPTGGAMARAAASLGALRSGLDHRLDQAGAAARAASPALGWGWLALSAVTLALTGATLLRARRARRRWPIAELSGERVRVAPAVGPAVLGIRRPEVVVPAWLLGASPREQRLVVIHEREHVRARDPLVLLAGCVAAAALAWNPATWWMLRRLRAAVELDCDARVLRHGVRPQEYGAVLIDIAGRGPGLSLGAPALAGSPSILERRLRAMTTKLPRYARLRASLLGVLSVAVLATACETPLPTSAELEQMDVAAVEARGSRLALTSEGETRFFVDGTQVTPQEARAISADRILRMEVTKAPVPSGTASAAPAGGGTVHIYTVAEGAESRRLSTRRETAGAASAGVTHTRVPRGAGAAGQGTIRVPRGGGSAGGDQVVVRSGSFDGLVFIDGVQSPAAALRTLDPQAIERIDILKGGEATRQYDDPRAANGVIRVTTKGGASRR